jgi:hypothetical protein
MHPIVPLVISMHAKKGMYALLLGSGISRAAQVPTGHEVVLDLIRKVALLEGEHCDPDPAVWYTHRHGRAPAYSELLAELAKSPPERSALLRGYFEPSDEERERGEKRPTEAHHAIARLVASGHIRIIITTNFDRLVEQALADAGIFSAVITTGDGAEGAEPLAHSGCTIIKVNGDYRDPHIRNTEQELAAYPVSLNRLLDQVFDEYGLIVCGWSAEWDKALRDGLERCKSRRYTTYWTYRGELTDAAQRLVQSRSGEAFHIKDADNFFSQLAEHVASLSDLDQPHLLSPKLAKAAVKRYVVDKAHRIRLHDLAMDEANRIYEELTGPLTGGYALPYHTDVAGNELEKRMKRYEALSEVLCAIITTGCYWGERQHLSNWTACLERLSNLPSVGGNNVWGNLRYYPALLGLYAGGIAALAANRYDTLASLLTTPKVNRWDHEVPLVLAINPYRVLNHDDSKMLPGYANSAIRFSHYLSTVPCLHEPLLEFLPRDAQFEECFDRFEYLLGLVHMDLSARPDERLWGPVGIFAARGRGVPRNIIAASVDQELESLGQNWPPLQAGLLGGSINRTRELKEDFDALGGRIVPS